MKNCTNCGLGVAENYCPHCGEAVQLERINRKYILNEIGKIFHLEKGIFYTIKSLLIWPGKSVHEYLFINRKKLIRPIIYLLLCSILFITISSQTIHDHEHDISVESDRLTQFTIDNFGYINIFISVFIAFWLKLFFKKNKYNYYETLIFLFYIVGTFMLINTFFELISYIINYDIVNWTVTLGLIYTLWAIPQFYNKKWSDYLKVFLAIILGIISFFIAAIFIYFLYRITIAKLFN